MTPAQEALLPRLEAACHDLVQFGREVEKAVPDCLRIARVAVSLGVMRSPEAADVVLALLSEREASSTALGDGDDVVSLLRGGGLLDPCVLPIAKRMVLDEAADTIEGLRRAQDQSEVGRRAAGDALERAAEALRARAVDRTIHGFTERGQEAEACAQRVFLESVRARMPAEPSGYEVATGGEVPIRPWLTPEQLSGWNGGA